MTTVHRGMPASHLTEFVGREAELRDLRTLVSSRRLVTVSGQAGVGKSRTAARVAEVLRRSVGGSTVLVPLAGVATSGLWSALAAAVGADDASAPGVARALGDRPWLIVLDDLDDALAAAPVLTGLLGSTVESRVLVTSRARAGVPGETAYVLPPLEVPTVSAVHGGREGVLRSPTCALLLQRVLHDDPAFDVTTAPLDDLLAVCRATDGLPRSVEAAARAIGFLGLRETALAVVEEPAVLDAFLPSGSEALSAAAVVESTLPRVSGQAVDLLRRLALLESGADLRFAADVFGGGSVARIAGPAAELVDHSLVRSEAVAGQRRLLVPLHHRQHLRAQLGEDDLASQQLALRTALLGRLRRCAAAWFSDHQLEEIQFLNRHAADVTALLGRMSSDPRDAHEALDVISSLRYYWQLHPVDPWPRARDWIASALSLDPARDRVARRAMLTDAYIAFLEGDVPGARAVLETVETTLDAEGADSPERTTAVFVEALVSLAEGDVHRAETDLVRLLDESLAAGELEHLGEKYWYLAVCRIASGEQDAALGTLHDGLAHCDQVGDVWGRAYVWCLLALLSGRRGSRSDALAGLRRSARVMADFGDRAGLTLCLQLYAAFSGREGDGLGAGATPGRAVARTALLRPPVPLDELAPPVASPDAQLTAWEGSSLLEMLASVLDPVAPRRTSVRPEAPRVVDVLSARESEISSLIAEGLSNPAIAARLVLSRRTVEGHVQRILAKLGFRSRSQIAVWAAQQGAAAPAPKG